PIELVEDIGSGEKGASEVSTANIAVTIAEVSTANISVTTAEVSTVNIAVTTAKVSTATENFVYIRRSA
ncbi:hypothetical protein Tco_0594437, partial [Tanacetum coccineum]